MTNETTTKPYILAADIGTTSTKTLVIDRAGRVVASHAIEYPLHTPRPEIAEQDPLEIYQAVVLGIQTAVRKAGISASEVLCVSFSSAMHSLIAVDKEGHPLTACITWADNRSSEQSARIKRELGGHEIYLRTGTPIHPMSPLTKLLWMKENDPATFEGAYKFLGIKEFVFARLFGRYVIDHSIASATGMFNLRHLTWDEGALALLGLPADKLPEPVPTTYKLQGLRAADAAEMGLETDTPFVVGASDGVLANLGAGAYEPGIYSVTIGTSGAVRGVVDRPITDPKGRLFCYALVEGFWVIGGAINNGGIMFRWVRDQLATLEAQEARSRGMDPYDYLTELAEKVPAGSEGLLFLPFLLGERAPYWNANARGVFFGLSMSHEKKHMIRSVLEGVIFRIHSVVQALEEVGGPTAEVRASGGFARSAFWRQMMADVLGTPVTVPESYESSGLGAAQLGLYAMGEIKDFSRVHEWVQTGSRHAVDPANHLVYKELAQIYMSVYEQLVGNFDAISAFQHKHASAR
ncbi:gluconate kinase [Paenibacillus sp. J31TS4]|uniref:gluconokinase n=1 Tax=Paenibacillus sp. J31TS4 TaxID=2807195 RepID=UPI001B22FAF3|nr:FGGY family carbohydrate kinase [Paenibacillus sp. J31TS4]GIP39754.1 gluconate kinase [Paenibacillus sp. J31TS4]